MQNNHPFNHDSNNNHNNQNNSSSNNNSNNNNHPSSGSSSMGYMSSNQAAGGQHPSLSPSSSSSMSPIANMMNNGPPGSSPNPNQIHRLTAPPNMSMMHNHQPSQQQQQHPHPNHHAFTHHPASNQQMQMQHQRMHLIQQQQQQHQNQMHHQSHNPHQHQHQQLLCCSCRKPITDRHLLKALDQLWHEDCLKCSACGCRLGEVGSKLYQKANMILCKTDYYRMFGRPGTCSACNKPIPAYEEVMRARDNNYHVRCFICVICKEEADSRRKERKSFAIGEKFYLSLDNRILCEQHEIQHTNTSTNNKINNKTAK